jgi:hypothetical protein
MLEPLCRAHGVELTLVDVDDCADWQERYAMRIPVLVAPDGELGAWPLDRTRILAWLAARGAGLQV